MYSFIYFYIKHLIFQAKKLFFQFIGVDFFIIICKKFFLTIIGILIISALMGSLFSFINFYFTISFDLQRIGVETDVSGTIFLDRTQWFVDDPMGQGKFALMLSEDELMNLPVSEKILLLDRLEIKMDKQYISSQFEALDKGLRSSANQWYLLSPRTLIFETFLSRPYWWFYYNMYLNNDIVFGSLRENYSIANPVIIYAQLAVSNYWRWYGYFAEAGLSIPLIAFSVCAVAICLLDLELMEYDSTNFYYRIYESERKNKNDPVLEQGPFDSESDFASSFVGKIGRFIYVDELEKPYSQDQLEAIFPYIQSEEFEDGEIDDEEDAPDEPETWSGDFDDEEDDDDDLLSEYDILVEEPFLSVLKPNLTLELVKNVNKSRFTLEDIFSYRESEFPGADNIKSITRRLSVPVFVNYYSRQRRLFKFKKRRRRVYSVFRRKRFKTFHEYYIYTRGRLYVRKKARRRRTIGKLEVFKNRFLKTDFLNTFEIIEFFFWFVSIWQFVVKFNLFIGPKIRSILFFNKNEKFKKLATLQRYKNFYLRFENFNKVFQMSNEFDVVQYTTFKKKQN